MGDPPRPAAHRAGGCVARWARRRPVGAMAGYLAVQQALSAIDRLEVRGRDSAGLHLFVWNHGLDRIRSGGRRSGGRAWRRSVVPIRSVRWIDGCLSFVYKAAAEIGELGDNTGCCARRSSATPCCAAPSRTARPGSPCSATRGGRASASSPSPTPIRSTARSSSDRAARRGRTSSPRSTVTSTTTPTSRSSTGCGSLAPITTDAKVIPASCRARRAAVDLVEAFRRTVAAFEGSRRHRRRDAADDPTRCCSPCVAAARRLYVGLADDCYIVASEPYGMVEETIATCASTARRRRRKPASRGQIFVLDGTRARRARRRPPVRLRRHASCR